jgi:hypothetical protein
MWEQGQALPVSDTVQGAFFIINGAVIRIAPTGPVGG